jgi:hypothetical protein
MLLLLLLALPAAGRTDPLDAWNWRNPLPTGDDIADAAWGNGTYVAVGANTILTSADGTRWSPLPSSCGLVSVRFLDGRFVAAGRGSILLSADGLEWSAVTPDPSCLFRSVARGNGRYVAVGQCGDAYPPYTGRIFTSADGAAWEERLAREDTVLTGAAFGNGIFLVVGQEGVILTSPDGLAWSERRVGETADLRSVAFGSGTFLAAGQHDAPLTLPILLLSADGENWEETDSPPRLLSLSWGEGAFRGVRDGHRITSSTDGRNWSAPVWPAERYPITAVTPGGGLTVAVGACGQIATSPDDTVWTSRHVHVTRTWVRQVVDGAGRLVGLGTGARYPRGRVVLLTSRTGRRWAVAEAPSFQGVTAMASGGGRLVAVGSRGKVLVSRNGGRTWRRGDSGTTHNLVGVGWGGGKFVALGRMEISPPDQEHTWYYPFILTSADGHAWAQTLDPTREEILLHDVAWGNGRFVAVGGIRGLGQGAVCSSADGIRWTRERPGRRIQTLVAAAFGNGTFVAVAEAGWIYRSADGETWAKSEEMVPLWIRDIAFGGGTFVLVGSARPEGGTVILTSADGVAWTGRAGGSPDLTDIAFGGGTFLATGTCGRIVQSDPPVPPPPPGPD